MGNAEFHGLVVGVADDDTITRQIQELTDKRLQQLVADRAVELWMNRPKESGGK